jgi:hypothetical protein
LVHSKQENSELQHAKKEIDTLREENRSLVQEKGKHIYIFFIQGRVSSIVMFFFSFFFDEVDVY